MTIPSKRMSSSRSERKSARVSPGWLDSRWLQRRLVNIGRRAGLSPEVRAWLRGQAVLRVTEAYMEAVAPRRLGGPRIVACKWVKLAVKRQRRDLARSRRDRAWPYVFDPIRAGQVVNYFRLLQHIKGRWARTREPIRLEPWQVFGHACVFGWVHRETGLRRFQYSYKEVARKNAKSTDAAGVCLYMLAGDGEEGAEVYPFATTGDQARVIFDVARAMVLKERRLQERIEVFANNINVPSSFSKMEPLNAKYSSNEGLNPSCGVADELHLHKTRGMWDVIENGMGAREQPLLYAITTAGSDQGGVCYEQHAYLKKVLLGIVDDDTYWGIIYCLDEDDDWTDPQCWIKANPNLGVSVFMKDLEALCHKAKVDPGRQATFKTKRCNLWVGALAAFYNIETWKKCANPALRREDLAGWKHWNAVDLATRFDIASRVDIYKGQLPGPRGPETHYRIFTRHWLPESALLDHDMETGGAVRTRNPYIERYRVWADMGHLQLTPGNVIDLDAIEAELLQDGRALHPQEIVVDPGHQALQIMLHLQKAGLPAVEVRNTVLTVSNPMKELKALIDSGRVQHDGNEVMTWMMSNVAFMVDKKDNVFHRKETEFNKIDGPTAAHIGMNRAMIDGGSTSTPTMWSMG